MTTMTAFPMDYDPTPVPYAPEVPEDSKLTPKQIEGPWTRFGDNLNGRDNLIPGVYFVYIQGAKNEAVERFKEMFDMDPTLKAPNPFDDQSTDLFNNFCIFSDTDLYQITAVERGCRYEKDLKQYVEGRISLKTERIPLELFVKRDDIRVIFKKEIQ